jgi:outer membrane lipoprotein-sorting protein
MKNVMLLCAVFVTMVSGMSFAQTPDAAEIIRRSKNLNDADTVSSRSRMVITARDGSTTERVIDQYAKDDAGRNTRAVIVFQSPATVRGTRFLTIDNTKGKSDQWIYLPTLGKIRRINSSESSGSFMGTDFSYDDMSSLDRDVEDDAHTILREEPYHSAACYVIQSLPKDSGFQYSKIISWIDKSLYLVYKRELYDRRGAVIKTMENTAFRDVQGRLTPMQTTLSTIAAGTSTTVYVDILKYDDPVPEGVFTTNYLETGRVR